MMEATEQENASLQRLGKYCRIVIRLPCGSLQFNEGNFNEILKSISDEKRRLPTSLAAIIGPPGSGKSFYTNLLVEYLQSEGKRGWLTNIILNGKSENNSTLLNNCGSGIYMYPEPFFDRSLGQETILWILHLHGPTDHFEETLDSMEALLILICSKLTEIIWNTEKLTVFRLNGICSEEAVIEKEEFCPNITFLNRTSAPSPTIIEDSEGVLKTLKELEPTLNESFLRERKCINITNIPNCAEPLHDNSGKLTITTELMKILDKCFRQIGDDVFSVKCVKKEDPLLLEQLGGYLSSKVALINDIFKGINKRRMNKIILEFEEHISKKCREKIHQEYTSALHIMIMEKGPFQYVHLKSINQLLVHKYIESLKRAQQLPSSIDNHGADFDNAKFMESDLKQAFQHFKIENNNMLTAKWKQLFTCISTCTRKYKESIGQLIRENPRGVERKALKSLHEKTKTEVKAELAKELSEKKFELIETHITTLQAHIDDAWIEFEERNVAVLKASAKANEYKVKKRAQMEELKQQQRDKSKNSGESSKNFVQGSSTIAIKSEVTKSKPSRGTVSDATKSRPPLIFQLTLSKIITSTQKGLKLAHIFPTPALVGVTKNDIWLFGDEVEKELQSTGESGFQWVWRIGECLTENGKWSQEITILEEKHKVTVEFLLGLLLHFLKEKVEHELKGEISTAIIIIPFWTASSQRRCVKDAGKIAGFRSVFLLNENTAVACAQAKLLRPKRKTSKFVILSENSGQVDVTVYSYGKITSGEELHMIAHGSAYLNQVSAVSQTFANVVSESGTRDDTAVFVSYESKEWVSTLSKVGLKFRKSLGAVRDLQFAMEGALRFNCRIVGGANGVWSMEHCKMTEWMSYDMLRCHDSCKTSVTLQQRDKLSLQIEHASVTEALRLNQREVSFCQSTVNGHINIGRLKMQRDVGDLFIQALMMRQLYYILQVEHDGVISLKSVEECKRLPPPYGLLPFNLSKREVSETDYEWITPNINEEEVVVFHSLVEPLFKQKAADAAKHELTERAEMMLSRIRNDEGSFRSEIARNMILDQIKGIIELVSRPRFSGIENQTAVLDEISRKYLNK